MFINGVLMIDLGGVHQRLPGKVHVNADGSATTQEGGNIYLACTNPTGQTNCPTIPAGYAGRRHRPLRRQRERRRSGHKGEVQLDLHGRRRTTCDCRVRTLTAAQTGLTPGNTYEIAVFSRDGHPTESNFQLTLSGFATNISICGALRRRGRAPAPRSATAATTASAPRPAAG